MVYDERPSTAEAAYGSHSVLHVGTNEVNIVNLKMTNRNQREGSEIHHTEPRVMFTRAHNQRRFKTFCNRKWKQAFLIVQVVPPRFSQLSSVWCIMNMTQINPSYGAWLCGVLLTLTPKCSVTPLPCSPSTPNDILSSRKMRTLYLYFSFTWWPIEI